MYEMDEKIMTKLYFHVGFMSVRLSSKTRPPTACGGASGGTSPTTCWGTSRGTPPTSCWARPPSIAGAVFCREKHAPNKLLGRSPGTRPNNLLGRFPGTRPNNLLGALPGDSSQQVVGALGGEVFDVLKFSQHTTTKRKYC